MHQDRPRPVAVGRKSLKDAGRTTCTDFDVGGDRGTREEAWRAVLARTAIFWIGVLSLATWALIIATALALV